MNSVSDLQTKLQNILFDESESYKKYDELDPATDEDYMLYSPKAVGYNTTAEQKFLFQNLVLGLDSSVYTVLDIGCGRCDLYGYLSEISNEVFGYNGVDMNPIMCDLATKKYNLDTPICSTFENLKIHNHDWVVAAGYFTQRKCATEDEDLIKLFTDVEKMYSLSDRIVSFNLLSPINNKIQEGFFYVHPGLVLDMLLEKYKYVNLRHNYSKDVYTVTIYKI
jgi:ubiquinone/menaquinone biosynthesis C-methylase UbiE